MPPHTHTRVAVILSASIATIGCVYWIHRARRTAKSQHHSLEDMEHQVGGHSCAKTGLKVYQGRALKPFQSKNRGEREYAFYELTRDRQLEFLPRYYGVVELHDPVLNETRRYLQLENLVANMQFPCIMDVKIGTKSYEPNATPEKIAYEAGKCPLQATLGFRLQGIKVFWDSTKEYKSYDKHFFRTLITEDSIEQGFLKFFEHGPDQVDQRASILPQFIARLEAIRGWFASQQDHHFIASSLLFVYDAANPARLDIRLIDFAHVQLHQSSIDVGVLTGIDSILHMLRNLHKTTTST